MSGTDDSVAVETSDRWPDDVDEDVGVVVNWFVAEGGQVEEGDSICEFQVEKVSVDVPAPATGTLAEIAIGEDEEFERGDRLALIRPA
ncbi:lipoyl domain-containing protein [Natrinema limicola]|uniref:Biotin/lipoyl attachment domain-containing protein n=1 Tax=Natrinema limicola JCM 13563 TaxID=1230457 RepID=M0CTX4_9EURY|nr:lipoyl domain-containing protein [Natrinema limicola]ELZ25329.1 biotin/lipoyl attachment domain-containing protein [Natrinema limicola JCM 13563]